MQSLSLPIQALLENPELCLSIGIPSSSLEQSVAQHGLCSVPEAARVQGQIWLSDGRKRLMCLKAMGRENAEVMVREYPDMQAAAASSWTARFFHRMASASAKALGWHFITSHGLDPEAVQLRQALQLSLKKTDLAILEHLLALSHEALVYLEEIDAGIPHVRSILRLGSEAFEALLSAWCIPLGCNSNQMRKLMELTADIKAAGSSDAALARLMAAPVSDDAGPALFQQLTGELHRLRYPELAPAEAAFADAAADIFGNAITVSHFSFEEGLLGFSFKAATAAEAVKKAAMISERQQPLENLYRFLEL